MTSKTSFFNFGLYKSTVKRYLWGAVLYFVILFMVTGISMFLNVDMYRGNETELYWRENSLLFTDSYIAIPLILAIFVPTVTALLVFRFVHSKNQSVYTHSLPISRRANFISQILAAFTLMYVPIILNAIILMLISFGSYGDYFTAYDCVRWALYNMYAIFLMFSCASLASFLTGNSFGMIAVNILIHSFLVLAVSTLGVMADMFIYGYSSNNVIMEAVSVNNFVTVIVSMCSKYFRENLSLLRMAGYALCAFILYILSYILYKKRKLENVGDVSGFKCLNHVFKYVICFLATMCVFAIFSSYMNENPIAFAIIVIIASIATYVAAEMVLNKTLKVLYSWKGYVAYAICFGILFSVFYGTTFFGYETRIPQKDDVAKVLISNKSYRYDDGYTDNSEIINAALDAHRDIVKKDAIPKQAYYNKYNEGYTNLYIKYKLNDGSTLERDYLIKIDKCHEIMNKCYEIDEYKLLTEEVFMDDSLIARVYLSNKEMIDLNKGEIMPHIREDTMNLSFGELNPWTEDDTYHPMYYIDIEYVRQGNPEINGGKEYLDGVGIIITDKYVKTCEYLKEKGYMPLDN